MRHVTKASRKRKVNKSPSYLGRFFRETGSSRSNHKIRGLREREPVWTWWPKYNKNVVVSAFIKCHTLNK